MTSKKDVLRLAHFGSRVAEDETDGLHAYFVETEQWRRLFAGEVDIVFGAKGAGKSALYSLLVSQKETLRLGRRTLFLPAENPRGTPAFRDLIPDPPASENQFRALWKLYFLALCANYFRHHLDKSNRINANASEVIDVLTKNGLLAPNIGLLGRLKAVLAYLHKYIPVLEGGIVEPTTGTTEGGRSLPLSSRFGDCSQIVAIPDSNQVSGFGSLSLGKCGRCGSSIYGASASCLLLRTKWSNPAGRARHEKGLRMCSPFFVSRRKAQARFFLKKAMVRCHASFAAASL